MGRTPAGYSWSGGGGCLNVKTACLLTVNPSPIPSRQISVTGHRSPLTTIVADFKSFASPGEFPMLALSLLVLVCYSCLIAECVQEIHRCDRPP